MALGVAAPAQAVSTGLVISEIFGANGAAAAYNQDYVEISNPTSAPISTTGMSVQYRSAAGTSTSSKVNLPDAFIPAGGTFLVGGASTTPTTAATISPDAANGSMNLSGTAGVVVLLNSQTQPFALPAGTDPATFPAAVIDLVGYGSTATTYETNRAPAPTTTGTPPNPVLTRIQADTDNNGANFAIAATGTPQACSCSAPSALKITEVYTDGGVAGATIDSDFVELQNVSGATLSMSGLTLQHRGPGDTGAATVVATLTGSMAANSFDVVQLSGTSGNGSPLANPEYTADLDLSAAGGTLFVAKAAEGYDPGTGAVVADQFRGDLVGWGTSNAFETTAADATDLSLTQSIQRENGGVDNDTNGADFDGYAPSPNAQPSAAFRTIPEIQGTAAETTMANANVSTEGVVTAAYANATGNLNGFYLQTPGYDPADDATPDASDGIFVFTGSSTTFPTPAVGKHVTIASGKVSEFSGMTELTVTNGANLTVRDATPAEAVTPGTVLPGTSCTISGATTDCLTGAALEAEREKHEGESFLPTSPYTISDSYDGSAWAQSGSFGFAMQGELGLAANDTNPLFAPTEMANPRLEPAKLAARVAYNNAHMITLDDGANIDYSSNANEDTAMPWLTGPDVTARIGANVSFTKPVILDRRNSFWRLQPQSKVTGDGAAQGITIEQDRPGVPDPVAGNLKLATFNMLNYFVHTGEDWVATGGDDTPGSGRTCSYFTDRDNNRITNDECLWDDPRIDPPLPAGVRAIGPRGAANAVNLTRQENKEVEAINTMAADVMSLEEVENPVKLGYADRDAALKRLVDALNADWAVQHSEDTVADPRWAYVASPRKEALPTITEQDAIRSAFIYNPRTVETQGASQVLATSPAFRNAREPLAQAFKRVGGTHDDAFILIVNHFKSKGSSTETGDNVDLGDGAGAFNGDRRRQAAALDAFAKQLSDQLQIEPVFLLGDFNAYSHEDPVVDLEEDGWHELAPDNGLKSYSFGGLAGTLDHAFANDAAQAMVQGSTVWPINANEPVFYEYSRFNANLTNLYAVNPFRSSDHNPEIIGIDAPLSPPPPPVDTVQVLAANDFHGRLLDDPASASAGAASMAGAVKELRAENPDTVFSMAGDIIGASTFESFIANDKPTIDAMNEAGLEVSAAGNHEFDRGYRDLLERVMDPTDPEGGADWEYLAANVRLDDGHGAASGDHALASAARGNSNGATWWKQLPGGKTIGFVGAMTEDLPSLVSPDSLAEVVITDVVTEVNASAAELSEPDGCGIEACDLVVLLVHEGAASPALAASTDPGTAFGHIVTETSPDVDAIVSGHTHLSYNHRIEVPAWVTEGRAVTRRPVVSAGQYGSYLNQLEFEFEQGTDNLVNIRQRVLAMKDHDADPDTQAIVDDAVDFAAVAGSAALGGVEGQFLRAQRNDPATGTVVENRGGESTLGNLVAEIQRWRTGADLGVMNPGGLRADLDVDDDGTITYREAADVQPFANTLMTVELTGAQIKSLLEQQWQRDAEGNIPSRPFLRLGTSKGFSFTEDATRAEGDRITGMWLDGEPIDAAAAYTVSATNFLVSGGDNFRALTEGTEKTDTGFTDLQATVDYLAANAPVGGAPLPVDFGQHGVGASVPTGPFAPGDTVTIPLSSLSMTGPGDVAESSVTLSYGGVDLDTETVATTLPTQPFDTPGTATVSFTMPSGIPAGTAWFELTGASGTVAQLPVQAADGRAATEVMAPDVSVAYSQAGSVVATVTPTGATGSVTFVEGATTLGTVDLGTDGGATTATYDFVANSLSVGVHTLKLSYGGSGAHKPSETTVQVTITKDDSTVAAHPATWTVGQTGSVVATVTPTGATGVVELYDGAAKLGEGTLATADGATTATIPVAAGALDVGSHDLRLAYSGDSVTKVAEGSVTVTVSKAATTVTGTPTTIHWSKGGNVGVRVTPSAATGTVELHNGGTRLGVATLSGGAASIRVGSKALPVGTHTLVVRYLGSATYASSQGTVTVTVTTGKQKP